MDQNLHFFSVYIKSGFSPCPVGITVAPCKHKSSIFKFLGWLSLVLCPRLTHARELYTISYHGAIYITFLPAHMYRNNGEPYSDHQVGWSASGSWGDLLADQGVICCPFMIRVHFKMLSEISGQNFWPEPMCSSLVVSNLYALWSKNLTRVLL